MPRRPTGYWDGRSRRYYARLGEVNEKTGKRRSVMLLHPDGTPIGFGDRRAVDEAIARLLAGQAGAEDRRANPTVSDLCNGFVAWHKANGSSDRTVRDHVYHLARFCAFSPHGTPYGARTARSIGLADLSAHRRAMEARGNQTGYVKLRYASVLACWRWAARPVEDRDPPRLLEVNPFEGLARPRRGRGKNRALPWPITRRAIRRGWGLAKTREYRRGANLDGERLRLLLMRFVAMTGCRPDEAARLRWDELDLAARVVRTVGKTTSRTGKVRRVPLPVSLAKALGRVSRWGNRHPEYVFLSARTRKTTPPGGHEMAEWFRDLRGRLIADDAARAPDDRTGLPPDATLYFLRHDWLSFGLEVESVEGVAAAGNNSPGVLLSTYEHTELRRIHEVSDRIDAARRKRGRGTDGA